MKKLTKELAQKSIAELGKKIGEIEHEIAKMVLEARVNPPKDSNALHKKRKQLAVTLTVLHDKREQ